MFLQVLVLGTMVLFEMLSKGIQTLRTYISSEYERERDVWSGLVGAA